MTELCYDCCPRCCGVLVFKPISSPFKDGSELGFRLTCDSCGWFDGDRFYSREDVNELKDEQEVEQ